MCQCDLNDEEFLEIGSEVRIVNPSYDCEDNDVSILTTDWHTEKGPHHRHKLRPADLFILLFFLACWNTYVCLLNASAVALCAVYLEEDYGRCAAFTLTWIIGSGFLLAWARIWNGQGELFSWAWVRLFFHLELPWMLMTMIAACVRSEWSCLYDWRLQYTKALSLLETGVHVIPQMLLQIFLVSSCHPATKIVQIVQAVYMLLSVVNICATVVATLPMRSLFEPACLTGESVNPFKWFWIWGICAARTLALASWSVGRGAWLLCPVAVQWGTAWILLSRPWKSDSESYSQKSILALVYVFVFVLPTIKCQKCVYLWVYLAQFGTDLLLLNRTESLPGLELIFRYVCLYSTGCGSAILYGVVCRMSAEGVQKAEQSAF